MSIAGNFTEAQQGEIKFPEISGPILEKVHSPTPLTEGPVWSSSAPKLLSQPFAPTPAPPALAIVLAVGPAPVPPAPGATPHPGLSLGTCVADGAVLLLQAALHESPGHASGVQDRAGARFGVADGC